MHGKADSGPSSEWARPAVNTHAAAWKVLHGRIDGRWSMPAHTALPAGQDEALTTIQSDPNRTTGEDGRPSTRGIALYVQRTNDDARDRLIHTWCILVVYSSSSTIETDMEKCAWVMIFLRSKL